MNYGQNRPNFHNGGHNMHSNHGPNNVSNISTTVSQSQQPPSTNLNNKLDTNISVQSQSRYKTMETTNLGNQQQQHQHSNQKSSMQTTSKMENILNMDRINLKDECGSDESSALNVIATSTTSSKTKTPMCLINELVRANQVCVK